VTEDEQQDWERGVMSARFFDGDALELATCVARSEGVTAVRARVSAYRRSRDRLLMIAAGCELAACVYLKAIDEA